MHSTDHGATAQRLPVATSPVRTLLLLLFATSRTLTRSRAEARLTSVRESRGCRMAIALSRCRSPTIHELILLASLGEGLSAPFEVHGTRADADEERYGHGYGYGCGCGCGHGLGYRYVEESKPGRQHLAPMPRTLCPQAAAHERKRRGHRASPPAHAAPEARPGSNSSLEPPHGHGRGKDALDSRAASSPLRSRGRRVPGTATLRAASPRSSPAPGQPTTWERVGAARHHAPVRNAEGESARQVCVRTAGGAGRSARSGRTCWAPGAFHLRPVVHPGTHASCIVSQRRR